MRFRSLSPIAPTLLVAFALGAAAQDVTGTILIDTRTVTFPKPGIVDIIAICTPTWRPRCRRRLLHSHPGRHAVHGKR